jgi:PPM family protein phosphatase
MASPSENYAGGRFLAADDQGPRDEQQDASICLSSPDNGTALIVVSDGVGGQRGGRMASQLVISVARRYWSERKGQFSDPQKDLEALSREAHNQIRSSGSLEKVSPRATIVALYLTSSRAYWVHSGDSRLYHFRAGQMIRRTEDHSVLQVLVAQGLVKEEDMGRHPDQGLLIQSLGGDDYKPVTFGFAESAAHDAFLLCTDGFWERTKVEEMADILFSAREQAPALLEQAVKQAVKRNGPDGDNVTVAVALPAAVRPAEVTGRIHLVEAPANPKTEGPRTLLAGGAILCLGAIVLIGWFCFSAFRAPVNQQTNTGSASPVQTAKPSSTQTSLTTPAAKQ